MSQENKIRVLVVDDSYLMRRIVSEILETDYRLEVIDTAQDGVEAVAKVSKLNPDVVTLDVNMPNMDGTEALRKIMAASPVPVIMLSAYTKKDADITFKCLEYGAVDFIEKPSGEVSLNLETLGKDLIEKVVQASGSNLKVRKAFHVTEKMHDDLFKDFKPGIDKVVTIGASTGGPSVIEEILQKMDPEINVPILIGQHMPEMFVKSFSIRLDKISPIHVKEAELGEEIKAGTAYLIPGDCNTKVKKVKEGMKTKFVFDFEKDQTGAKVIYPSINALFTSVAESYGNGTVAIILTGMGDDGVVGMSSIKAMGGKTIAQDKDSALIYGMPGEAIKYGCINKIMTPQEIIRIINTYGQL